MTKTFTYERPVASAYLPETDENEEFTEPITYEVDDEEITDALADLIFCDYFKKTELADRHDYCVAVKSAIREILRGNDKVKGELADNYEQDLKDYFEADAL